MVWERVFVMFWKVNTQQGHVVGLRAKLNTYCKRVDELSYIFRHLDSGVSADEQRLAQARSQGMPDAPHDELLSRTRRTPLGSTAHSHRQTTSPVLRVDGGRWPIPFGECDVGDPPTWSCFGLDRSSRALASNVKGMIEFSLALLGGVRAKSIQVSSSLGQVWIASTLFLSFRSQWFPQAPHHKTHCFFFQLFSSWWAATHQMKSSTFQNVDQCEGTLSFLRRHCSSQESCAPHYVAQVFLTVVPDCKQ